MFKWLTFLLCLCIALTGRQANAEWTDDDYSYSVISQFDEEEGRSLRSGSRSSGSRGGGSYSSRSSYSYKGSYTSYGSYKSSYSYGYYGKSYYYGYGYNSSTRYRAPKKVYDPM